MTDRGAPRPGRTTRLQRGWGGGAQACHRLSSAAGALGFCPPPEAGFWGTRDINRFARLIYSRVSELGFFGKGYLH